MNVWILNHYAVTPEKPGGTRHYDFARELCRRGHTVTIFASSFHYTLLKEKKEYGEKNFIIEDVNGVRFVWMKTFPYDRNNWRRVLNMLSYSRSVSKVACDLDLGRPDVILGSSVHLFAVYTAYRLSRRLRAPFVMEVRDIWPQTLIDMGVSKWHPFVLLLGFLERYLYKKAIRIITLLPRANEHIESFGVKPDKIVWIPNGVDGERFDAVQVRPEESSRQFTITYTGAIGTANNLTVLLKAAEILGNEFPYIKFLIVGDGPEKPRLLRMADDKKLENVEFKAPVPKDEVSNIHSQSDALLFTLQDSPVFKFGISSNKLFDYLTSGKPVIFSCNSANNPVNEAGAGITIPPDDPQKLVDTAIALSEMPIAERAKMGSNGRQYIEKHHLIATLVDRLEQIFITA